MTLALKKHNISQCIASVISTFRCECFKEDGVYKLQRKFKRVSLHYSKEVNYCVPAHDKESVHGVITRVSSNPYKSIT